MNGISLIGYVLVEHLQVSDLLDLVFVQDLQLCVLLALHFNGQLVLLFGFELIVLDNHPLE